ncbi:MAG: endopeptidase La [Acidobacteria bacterium RIFCSPLOWO2_12_FULL_68_19]|nr:MAG: endopeptidase La [Acidobacteria bacterium RIFCSPLOWO2_12_FULL_68_19]
MEVYETLPIVPLRDVVVFPHMMMPFVIGRPSSIRALEHALLKDKRIFLAAQHDASIDDPGPDDIYTMGCVANVVQSLKLPDGNIKVLVEGVDRGRAVEWKEDKGFYRVVVKVLPRQKEAPGSDVEGTMSRVVSLFEQYVKLSNNLHYDAMIAAVRVDDPGKLADTIAAHLVIGVDEKQNLLEIISPLERLNRIAGILEIEVDKLQVDRRIQSRVKKQMEKAQKEYYLNEKMKAIQKELGRKDDKGNEVEELQKKIKDARMPKEVEEKATQELKRLEAMPPMSAEATVSRNYLDWLIAVPWHRKTRENRDLKHAETVLNEDHYGLEKIKERILEFLAIRTLVRKPKATILTFSGPPGVGKTSLAKSIARAMNRKFVRLSLGGVRDEAEIRGHRRTYIGAFPGQIIQMMKKAGTLNPVFLLDEVDKMSMDFRGDPSAALLEVLDPEQNNTFLDHYLDVEFDLSHVMFICTANVLHTIPQALRDRMEVLNLPGYTEHEKIEIAKRFLVPKAVEGTGLTKSNIVIQDEAIQTLIQRYTREAGVRNLEREISSICRKVARKVVAEGKAFSEDITAEKVTEYLGVPRFRPTVAEEKNEIGIATGLAWTEVGGELLVSEATLMPGKGKLTLTGKLGDVMQESAQAALSYIRSKAAELGLPEDFHSKIDIHVHVPEGAIPKDGPSAGITMATALASAVTRIPTRRDVAMTGEITLRGKVLPIGGVKEKVLAAHRAGVTNIVLPRDNEKDLADIPKDVLDSLDVHMVSTMDEVLKIALAEPLPVRIPTAPVVPEVAEAGDTPTTH